MKRFQGEFIIASSDMKWKQAIALSKSMINSHYL